MDLHSAKEMALRLMDLHIQEPGWTFEFMGAKRRFGACWHGPKLIGLSKPLTLLNDISEVRNVILHEIAHAIAGYEAGHGPTWKRVASALGARPERCFTGKQVVLVEGKWQYQCPNCKHITHRYRPLRKVSACGKCCRDYSGGEFDGRFTLLPYHGEPVAAPVVEPRRIPAAQTRPTQLSLI